MERKFCVLVPEYREWFGGTFTAANSRTWTVTVDFFRDCAVFQDGVFKVDSQTLRIQLLNVYKSYSIGVLNI